MMKVFRRGEIPPHLLEFFEPARALELGSEPTPAEYVASMVAVFREVRRVLRDDGVLWLNVGDSYAGSSTSGAASSSTLVGTPNADRAGCGPGKKRPDGLNTKDLVGVPWMLAFALRADGWILRSDTIWHKPNPMPESVTDRPTKAHEYVFLLSKSERYHYDAAAIAEPATSGGPRVDKEHLVVVGDPRDAGVYHGRCGQPEDGNRNARSVWTIASQPFDGAHFAVMPPKLAERCILAGSRIGDEVLDPFLGSGTVGMVAERNGRRWFGVELNPKYEAIIKQRTAQAGLFGRVGAA